MIADVTIEIFLALLAWFAGRSLWQVLKRDSFVSSLLRDALALSNLISRGRLDTVSGSPATVAYTQRTPNATSGYSLNVLALFAADTGAGRRIKLLSSLLLVTVAIGSYFSGVAFLAINAAIIALSALPSLSKPGLSNALVQVVTLAVIIDKWHGENAVDCQAWIDRTQEFSTLYEAVKAAR